MRAIFYILTTAFLISCQPGTKPSSDIKAAPENQNGIVGKDIPLWEIDQDTVLEKNSPQNLDLTRHQLFMDTTRNSIFYKSYINWVPHEFYKQATEYYIEEISKKYKPKDIRIGDFPKTWITLEKLNNEFVVYDKCDGTTTRYFIDKNSVNLYAMEADSDIIHSLKKLTDTEIEIELRTIPQKSKSEKGLLSIKKTGFDYIYLLTIDYGEWKSRALVTPLKHVDKFDLVVNNCVKMKRMEFNGFDEIRFNEY